MMYARPKSKPLKSGVTNTNHYPTTCPMKKKKLTLIFHILLPFTQRQEDFKDEDAKEESKGICGPDMWYSPKGKSIPCAILIVILWIVFLPFVIIFGFSVLLWLCLSKCYTYFFMAGLQSSRNVEGPN